MTRAGALRVAGSGVNLPLVRAVAAHYGEHRPTPRIAVEESIGTGGAVQALLDGAIDIGLGSRPLSSAERDAGIREVPWARAALVFAAHTAGRPVLSLAALTAAYQGRKSSFADGTPMVPFLREQSDSGNQLIARAFPTLRQAMVDALEQERWPVRYSDREMLEGLVTVTGALGPVDLGSLLLEQVPLAVVRLEGVPDAEDGLGDGSYPLVRTLTLLTTSAHDPERDAFIAYACSDATDELFARGAYLRMRAARP